MEKNQFIKSNLAIKLLLISLCITIFSVILPFGIRITEFYFDFVSGYDYGLVTIFLYLSIVMLLFTIYIHLKAKDRERLDISKKSLLLGILLTLFTILLAGVFNFLETGLREGVTISGDFDFIPFGVFFISFGSIFLFIAQIFNIFAFILIYRSLNPNSVQKEGFFYDRTSDKLGINKYGFISLGLKILPFILIFLAIFLPIVAVTFENADVSLIMTLLGTTFAFGSAYQQSIRIEAEERFQSISEALLVFIIAFVILALLSIVMLYFYRKNLSGFFGFLALFPLFIYFLNFFVLDSLNGERINNILVSVDFGIGYYFIILAMLSNFLSLFFEFKKNINENNRSQGIH